MPVPSVSVVIAAYNEDRTIATIVEIVYAWGRAHEIIVVDDGSTDRTAKSVARLRPGVTLISYTKNRGKGYALAQGIKKSTGDILMFLDGDITGLTRLDLDAMMDPILHNRADMVLGVARFSKVGSFAPFDGLTGERVMWRKAVVGHVSKMLDAGRGVEFLFNDLHRRKRVVSVDLPYVAIMGKWERGNAPVAAVDYLKEAMEFVRQITKLQAGDLPPKAKRALRAVYGYLSQALDYFQ